MKPRESRSPDRPPLFGKCWKEINEESNAGLNRGVCSGETISRKELRHRADRSAVSWVGPNSQPILCPVNLPARKCSQALSLPRWKCENQRPG
jgi:hypothetical protein